MLGHCLEQLQRLQPLNAAAEHAADRQAAASSELTMATGAPLRRLARWKLPVEPLRRTPVESPQPIAGFILGGLDSGSMPHRRPN